MSTIYGDGGVGVVASTATPAAPATLYQQSLDISVGNLFCVKHTATTDGSTASASWLRIKVTDLGGKLSYDTLMPGDTRYYQVGYNTNLISKIEGWSLGAGTNSTTSNGNVCVTIGVTSKR